MRDNYIYPVAKELIPFLEFPKNDVLYSVPDQERRKEEAHRAMILGNLDHVKVRIIFSDKVSYKVVETTIWGLTDKAVILKANICLPLSRILRVQNIQ